MVFFGVELQVHREREVVVRPSSGNPALALEEAKEQRAQYLRDGGALIV
jgi:hypothetical protein